MITLKRGDQDDSYWNFKHFLDSASHPIYGRSEVYFWATVNLAKARRCFSEEPRNTLRRTHKTVKLTYWTTFSWGALLCRYGAYRYLCVRLVDKTVQLTHWTTFSLQGSVGSYYDWVTPTCI